MRIQDLFTYYDPNPPAARPETQRLANDGGYNTQGAVPLASQMSVSPLVLIKQGNMVMIDVGGYTVEMPEWPQVLIIPMK